MTEYSNDKFGKKIVSNELINAVDTQIREHNPAFVEEIFHNLQLKGCNRKEARTVIASVLLEEMYYILRNGREYDEKRYEKALRKKVRTMMNPYGIPDIPLDLEAEINDICGAVLEAIENDDDEEAAVQFLTVWPKIVSYVKDNLYRDTKSGIEKPDLSYLQDMTEYRMTFDSLLLDMGMYLSNAGRYQEAIDYGMELLDLFQWEISEPDSVRDDIGQAYFAMGRTEEGDEWFHRWLEEEPDSGNCVNAYAFCYQMQGNLEKALGILEAHLPKEEMIDLKYENLYIRAADLYEAVGNQEKAEHYSELLKKMQEEKRKVYSSGWENENWDDEDWDEEAWYDRPVQKPVVKEKKIYPNDPCPCGSGRKYKKCCGRG